MSKMEKIILTDVEPGISSGVEDLAKVVINRLGLAPRKKGSTDKMHKLLVQLYERAKNAAQNKDQRLAVMTVEEMAFYTDITRQTMYEYLRRWLEISLVVKTSYIDQEGKSIVGYRLNGNNLEDAFEKTQMKVRNNLEFTHKYVKELQRLIKNEKIRGKQKEKED